MKKIILSLILSCSVLLLTAQIDRSKPPVSGPAPEINLGKPKTFSLDNGLKVIVVENSKLPRAFANLEIDNYPDYEGDIMGVSSLVSSMMGNGTENQSKESYNEEVDYMGATLFLSASGGYVSSLKRYFPRVLELMASAVLEPLLTQEEFDNQKNLIKESLKTSDKDVSTAASRVQDLITYGPKHPNGEFISQESLDRATLKDAIDFYNNYSSPSNAYLVIIGDIEFEEVKSKITELFSSWESKEVTSESFPQPESPSETEIIFVDMPNGCLLYTSPSPRDRTRSRMPSSA